MRKSILSVGLIACAFSGAVVACGDGDRDVAQALEEVQSGPVVGGDVTWSDDSSGDEIADICQGVQGSVAGYTVQKAWSQAQQACVTHNPCLACAAGTSCHCGRLRLPSHRHPLPLTIGALRRDAPHLGRAALDPGGGPFMRSERT